MRRTFSVWKVCRLKSFVHERNQEKVSSTSAEAATAGFCSKFSQPCLLQKHPVWWLTLHSDPSIQANLDMQRKVFHCVVMWWIFCRLVWQEQHNKANKKSLQLWLAVRHHTQTGRLRTGKRTADLFSSLMWRVIKALFSNVLLTHDTLIKYLHTCISIDNELDNVCV